MKDIVMYIQAGCPYCRQARLWMEELYKANPDYSLPPLTVIDEELKPDIAARADYYYVPTYFVGGVKIHEGAATKSRIERVFKAALED